MANRRCALAVLSVFAFISPAVKAANVPRKAPEFAIHLTGGKQLMLRQYHGKVVALVFILTTCPHCQKAVRCLAEDQKEFGSRGLQVVASAIEEMAQINLPDFVRQYAPPFPVGYNHQRLVLDFMQHVPMGPGPIMPMLAFIDRQGVICAQYEGNDPFLAQDQMEKNLRDKIASLVEQAAPAPASKRRIIRKKASVVSRQSSVVGR